MDKQGLDFGIGDNSPQNLEDDQIGAIRGQIIEDSRLININVEKTCAAVCYGTLAEFTEMNNEYVEKTVFYPRDYEESEKEEKEQGEENPEEVDDSTKIEEKLHKNNSFPTNLKSNVKPLQEQNFRQSSQKPGNLSKTISRERKPKREIKQASKAKKQAQEPPTFTQPADLQSQRSRGGRPAKNIKFQQIKEGFVVQKRGLFRDFKKKLKEIFVLLEMGHKSRLANREAYDNCRFQRTIFEIYTQCLSEEHQRALEQFAKDCFCCKSQDYVKKHNEKIKKKPGFGFIESIGNVCYNFKQSTKEEFFENPLFCVLFSLYVLTLENNGRDFYESLVDRPGSDDFEALRLLKLDMKRELSDHLEQNPDLRKFQLAFQEKMGFQSA